MAQGGIPVLVAGGAGYIGSHTAKVLWRQGMLPVTVDNLVTGNAWAVRFGPFVQASIADGGAIRKTVQEYRIECAILFAAHAYVGESTRHPAKYYGNNVSASLAFLDALMESGVTRLVFSSSCSIYGVQERQPIGEDDPKSPLSPYAETKWFLEQVLDSYDRAYGLRSVCLRYFNAAGADPESEIGEWHDPETHLIPRAMAAAAGGAALEIMGTDYPTPDGTAIRDYVHVTDLADAHTRALRHLLAGGFSERFNCGTGQGHSVRQVIESVERVSGKPVPVQLGPRRVGDAPALVANAARIREKLGWTPQHSELDAITGTAWRWYADGSQARVAQ